VEEWVSEGVGGWGVGGGGTAAPHAGATSCAPPARGLCGRAGARPSRICAPAGM